MTIGLITKLAKYSTQLINELGKGTSALTKVTDLEATLGSDSGPTKVPFVAGFRNDNNAIRSKTNQSKDFLVGSVPGNPEAFANFIKTDVVNIAKKGLYEPPYLYDQAGNEYIEKRPVSFTHVPQVVVDSSPKLVVLSPFNVEQIIVVTSKEAGGYLLHGLANNITVNTPDSLGTRGDEPTMYRMVSVQNAVSVLVGKMGTPVLSNPTVAHVWADKSLGEILPEIPPFTSSFAYIYKQTNGVNDVMTFSAMVPTDGFINLSFVCSSSGNPAATIKVGGVVNTVNLVSATAKIRTFRFPVNGDSTEVVITNVSGGAVYFLNYLGQDFSTLNKWRESAIDRWGYYRNAAEIDHLLVQSDNDWTGKEYNTQCYGGGYHGGESNITNSCKMDGVIYAPTATPKVGRKVSMNLSCTVDWTPAWTLPAPAPVINVRKRYDFTTGGYYVAVAMTGKIVFAELYSALFGAQQSFNQLEVPRFIDINTAVANTERLLIGRNSVVTLRNPTTGQTISAQYTVSSLDRASQYGGGFIWRIDGAGGYMKMYDADAHGGRLEIDSHYSCTGMKFT